MSDLFSRAADRGAISQCGYVWKGRFEMDGKCLCFACEKLGDNPVIRGRSVIKWRTLQKASFVCKWSFYLARKEMNENWEIQPQEFVTCFPGIKSASIFQFLWPSPPVPTPFPSPATPPFRSPFIFCNLRQLLKKNGCPSLTAAGVLCVPVLLLQFLRTYLNIIKRSTYFCTCIVCVVHNTHYWVRSRNDWGLMCFINFLSSEQNCSSFFSIVNTRECTSKMCLPIRL